MSSCLRGSFFSETKTELGGLYGIELASEKVAELVKSFVHFNEILDGFRYKIGAYPLNSNQFGFIPDYPVGANVS